MEEKICQSCGMPLKEAVDFGTNADGSSNNEYCSYCFKDGSFTNDISMDEMIEINLDYLDEYNKDAEQKVTKEEAREQMKTYFPTLKRWNNN
ncbi:MAG: zinc ribbon domain-containing protein [Bacteroidales bacterium]|jgi:hypothetical protein|nr:zinc ribbon domain-containing protein [Bacteroidales bacterium]